MRIQSIFFRSLSLVLVFVFCLTLVPVLPLQAAMLDTGAVLHSKEVEQARQDLQDFLQREEVAKALQKQGIDPEEARARVHALSDSEVRTVAARLPELPAGQGTVGTIVGAALFIFVILLITDILGYTDVFNFVRKEPAR